MRFQTCCRSSLSDFSCATMALMQPFIEHNVACERDEAKQTLDTLKIK